MIPIKKSIWMELFEWCVLAMVTLFTFGVLAMRAEITSPPGSDSTAPLVSFDE